MRSIRPPLTASPVVAWIPDDGLAARQGQEFWDAGGVRRRAG